VYAPGRVTLHRVQGAVVLYLNFAIIFGSAYRLMWDLIPTAFANLAAPASGNRNRWLVVQYEKVGWPSEGAGKGQPGALAAGQHADGGASLLGAEQEILHVSDHMAALTLYCHGVATSTGKRLS
jgi:hypothetical protein